MKYMLLIDEAEGREVMPSEQEAMMNEYWAYTDMLQKNGHYIAGDALQPIMR